MGRSGTDGRHCLTVTDLPLSLSLPLCFSASPLLRRRPSFVSCVLRPTRYLDERDHPAACTFRCCLSRSLKSPAKMARLSVRSNALEWEPADTLTFTSDLVAKTFDLPLSCWPITYRLKRAIEVNRVAESCLPLINPEHDAR